MAAGVHLLAALRQGDGTAQTFPNAPHLRPTRRTRNWD